MGIEEFGERQEFNLSQFPEGAFLLDPDGILQYTLELLNAERGEEEELLAGLLDLFDVDATPERYIPYLADLIGFKPKATDPAEVKRSQIKQAVAWYKAKGMPVAFDIILNAIGYPGRVVELWTDGATCEQWSDLLPEDYTCEDIPEGWNPHSRIDLEVDINLETLSTRHPEGFSSVQAYLLKNIEEVRPIHVLLRQIHIIFSLYDQYPSDEIVDELDGTVYGDLYDYWTTTYFGDCGIWHFDQPHGFFRDGGGYVWERDAIDFVAALPPTPDTGDRYIWHGKIVEWDGLVWVETLPQQGTALWLKPTPDRETWFWIFFVESSNEAYAEAQTFGWDTGLKWDDYTFAWDDGVLWDGEYTGWDGGYAEDLNVWDASGSWYFGTGLCESAPYMPGDVVFRDCPCAFDWEGPGPWDELYVEVAMQDFDPYAYCLFHDGTIVARDATWWHNCNHPTDNQIADEDQNYLIRHNGFIEYRTSDYYRRRTIIPYKNSVRIADVLGRFEDKVGPITDALNIVAIPV